MLDLMRHATHSCTMRHIHAKCHTVAIYFEMSPMQRHTPAAVLAAHINPKKL